LLKLTQKFHDRDKDQPLKPPDLQRGLERWVSLKENRNGPQHGGKESLTW